MNTSSPAVLTKPRPIAVIAEDICDAWPRPNYAAVPYLEALSSIETINDMYGCDDARSIVLYFLSNASTFRGGKAKILKEELKAHLNMKSSAASSLVAA